MRSLKYYIFFVLGCFFFQGCLSMIQSAPKFKRKQADNKDFAIISSRNNNIKSSFLIPENLDAHSSIGGVIYINPKPIENEYPYQLSVTYKTVEQILGGKYNSSNQIDSVFNDYVKFKKERNGLDTIKVIQTKNGNIGELPAKEGKFSYVSEGKTYFTNSAIALWKDKVYLLNAYYDKENEEKSLEVFKIIKNSFKPL